MHLLDHSCCGPCPESPLLQQPPLLKLPSLPVPPAASQRVWMVKPIDAAEGGCAAPIETRPPPPIHPIAWLRLLLPPSASTAAAANVVPAAVTTSVAAAVAGAVAASAALSQHRIVEPIGVAEGQTALHRQPAAPRAAPAMEQNQSSNGRVLLLRSIHAHTIDSHLFALGGLCWLQLRMGSRILICLCFVLFCHEPRDLLRKILYNRPCWRSSADKSLNKLRFDQLASIHALFTPRC